jgi:hypothetical protein
MILSDSMSNVSALQQNPDEFDRMLPSQSTIVILTILAEKGAFKCFARIRRVGTKNSDRQVSANADSSLALCPSSLTENQRSVSLSDVAQRPTQFVSVIGLFLRSPVILFCDFASNIS